jgi:AraC-like DNA-binding protein
MTVGFTLGCIAIIVMAILKSHGKLFISYVFIALLLASADFVLSPLLPNRWDVLSASIYTTIPALFWLFCQLAFRDSKQISAYWISIAAYSSIVPALYRTSPGLGSYVPLLEFTMITLPGYLEYVLIGAGLWAVIKHWSDDLIESRRRFRALVVILVGLTVLVNVISVNLGWGDVLFQRLVILFAVLVTGYHVISVPSGILFGPMDAKKLPLNPIAAMPIESKQQTQLDALNALMSDGFYRKEKLTIAQLSRELSTPEYIVRNLINEQLGFRNFNDFVNQWRINDAKLQLINEPDKPVMNIALDLGYRTLSSFNRAFKERTEKTPTQYRASR